MRGWRYCKRVQGKMKEWARGKEEKSEEGKVSQPTVVNSPPAGSSVFSPDQLRKEFKIKGQIGDPGQKDKLPFSSLVHQIDRALSRGYPEEDIVDAIITMVPGLPLRAYLETKPALNLPVLRRLLCSHYCEKEATELYHDLTRAVQDPKESPQEFLLRMLALRQKILFASQEADAAFTYDSTLVQGMFLHSLLTGIANENIKGDLKPLLQDVSTTDEALLEKVNITANNETERQQKQTSTRRTTVQEVNASTPKGSEGQKRDESTPRHGEALNLRQMREDIRATVRSELAAVTQPQPSVPPPQTFVLITTIQASHGFFFLLF